MQPAIASAGFSHRAVSVGARTGWMLIALLPGIVLGGYAYGPGAAWRLLDTVVIAVLADLVVSRARRTPLSTIRYREVVLTAAVVALWLPAAMPWWAVALAAILAITPSRLLFDEDAVNPFHPAMAACAVVLMFAPSLPLPPAGFVGPLWIAAALGLGGLALIAARCIRWQAPVAMLVGAAIVSSGWSLFDRPLPTDASVLACLPALVLTAFFIADDPPRTCMRPRARILFGFMAGALAMAAAIGLHGAHHDARMLPALAGSVLLMNAAAPWLDRLFASPRSSPVPAA